MDQMSFAILAKKEEFPFYISVLILVIAQIVITVMTSSKAERLGGTITESKAEGLSLFVQMLFIGGVLGYSILYFLLVGYAEFEKPALLQTTKIPLKPGVRWIAVHGLALYVIFAYWAMTTLGANWISGVGLRENHKLVTTGPYRYLRHPIYSGYVFAAAVLSVTFADWAFAIIAGLASMLTLWLASYEDPLLGARFKGQYGAYKRRTGMFFPKL